MALRHIITRAYRDTSGASITSTEQVDADSEINFDGLITGETVGVEIDYAVTRANMKSLSVFCASALNVRAEAAASQAVEDVTNAAAADVVIEITGHGYSVGDPVRVLGVGGATQVNGTWYVESVPTDDTFTIEATPGDGALQGDDNSYTSGGEVFEQELLPLVAGQNLIWSLNQDGLIKCPFPFNVGQVFADNDNVADVTLKIRTLTDQTP